MNNSMKRLSFVLGTVLPSLLLFSVQLNAQVLTTTYDGVISFDMGLSECLQTYEGCTGVDNRRDGGKQMYFSFSYLDIDPSVVAGNCTVVFNSRNQIKEVSYSYQYKPVSSSSISHLEEWIKRISKDAPKIQRTSIPGGSDICVRDYKVATLQFENGIVRIEDRLLRLSGGYTNIMAIEYTIVTPIKKKVDVIKAVTGSGFLVNNHGIVCTNCHVVEGASSILVTVNQKQYKALVLGKDKNNDLAILRLSDFHDATISVPYTISRSSEEVGVRVIAMGYPMSSVLGEELKVTDGIISSKSGYQGDITTYQISAPIQPGNSGGPLFSDNGLLIGITNAGVPDAQNVGYAIKSIYLLNLLDALDVEIPNKSRMKNTITENVRIARPYVVQIKAE